MKKYIGLLISCFLLFCIYNCSHKQSAVNEKANYFNLPILKVKPNQLLSIFDSVIIQNNYGNQKDNYGASMVCFLMKPDVYFNNKARKAENNKGSLRIDVDIHHSDSFFNVEEFRSSYMGVVIHRQNVIFIDKYFNTSNWFQITSNIIKLKESNATNESIPLPPAPDGLSWIVKYNKDRFYFKNGNIYR